MYHTASSKPLYIYCQASLKCATTTTIQRQKSLEKGIRAVTLNFVKPLQTEIYKNALAFQFGFDCDTVLLYACTITNDYFDKPVSITHIGW